jgi:hypothetical protein
VRERIERVCEIWWSAVIILWLLSGAIAQAQPPLTITQAGYYITVVDESGVPSLVELSTVVDLRKGGEPDTPDDKPDIDPQLVRSVEAWSDLVVDPLGAQAIAAVYSHLRLALKDGILTTDNVWITSKLATDSALSIVGTGKDWTGFRRSVSDEIGTRKSQGRLASSRDVQRVMHSLQHGLELSADGSTALSMDQLVRIASATNEAIDGQSR